MQLRRVVLGTALVAGVLSLAAGWRSHEAAAPPPKTNMALRPIGDGINTAALDLSTDPCSNFYKHACGGFLDRYPASAENPEISLVQLQFDYDLENGLKNILEQSPGDDVELKRLQTFYRSCISGTSSDRNAVRQWLARIDAANSRASLQRVVRDLAAIGVNAFVTYDGRPDRNDPTHYRGEIHTGTLWFDPDVARRTFETIGESKTAAARDARAVGAVTAALKKHRVDRWDAKRAENPRSIEQLKQLAPAFDWESYFAQAKAMPRRPINLTSPDFLRDLNEELRNRRPAELKAYLRWAFLFSLRGELPAPYSQPFAQAPPNIRPEMRDSAGRCRDATVRAMGVEFSRQYSERILGIRARDAARTLSETIKGEIVASLQTADWLTPAARSATVDKVRKTDLKIGFPDLWPAVGDFPLRGDRFMENVLAARRYEQQREWARASRPRSRTAWEMEVSPWVGQGMAAARLVVPNGYPDAFSNSLIMTAAFLTAPRFDAEASPELNYATYGSVFAHEFVHVAQLHMFGPNGEDRELWSPADEKAAEDRGQCVVEQADAFEPVPGLHLPGNDEFDENVADYGGIRLAYEALKRTLGEGIDMRDSSGTSPAQRFFYRYAQYRCTSQTEAGLRQSVENDSHAPAEFRVNGPISNMPEFGRAFACPIAAPMVRSHQQQCRVW
jgi:endothelin-converting enzyme/putative endopeptidase